MGYGKKLLEKTIELAKRKDFERIRLYTDKYENADAIYLYEKMGFVGEKYVTEKLPYDCWIYSKSLTNEKINSIGNLNLQILEQIEYQDYNEERIKEILKNYKNLMK